MENPPMETDKLPVLQQTVPIEGEPNQVESQDPVADQIPAQPSPQIHDQPPEQTRHTEQDMPAAVAEQVSSSTSYNNNGYSNGHQADGHSPHSIDYPTSSQSFVPQDIESSPRHHSPTMSFQQPSQFSQSAQASSRPSSRMSGGGDRYGYTQPYQDQSREQRQSQPQPQPQQQQQQQQQQQPAPSKNSVVIKVGMVGDAQIGKTSLMVKYVEGSWDEDYIQTLGVNFMEKTISIRNTEITFSIWDLGGQREFVNMLPLVCNDAVAILFMFDLTRKSTLNSIKEWYRQGRGFNKTAIPFLIGTKYDHFVNFPREDQEEISIQAKRFAKAMRASLIFSSTSHSINVQKIFKIVLSKAFDLKCTIPEIENIGEPLLLYQSVN
ncbi:septum-promoting GTP-binding protein [Histoplasma capsulatum G186AR]|uniref:Septum-promoting GTP-binding protein n=1 Tax=Ajellomyces capsulatus TaxID=5037 RepID=A0A8H7Z0N3_AJECA|nr:septum-promoting GTP-binding protein [Histoplasma capsulatum]QSS73087.1 septum-promoting GTP-binding protein [Histoplasma capsulatum G186AR]